ncbi:hypothetical protein [Bacteroides sp.]|nr:hypothetical protein [Bacteroides sp.]
MRYRIEHLLQELARCGLYHILAWKELPYKPDLQLIDQDIGEYHD